MTANPKMTAPPEKKRWHERIHRSGYFVGAVLLHVIIFIMVCTFVIFPAPRQSHDAYFQAVQIKAPPPPPPAPPSTSGSASLTALEPDTTVTPPTLAPSIVHTSESNFNVDAVKVALPNLPASLSSPVGSGLGGSGSGSSGDGSTSNPFGTASGSNETLVGTLYDFTKMQDGTPVTMAPFKDIVNDFVKQHWVPGHAHPCFVSHHRIYSRQVFVPVTPDSDAGTAFGSPGSSNAFWLVHYVVEISSNDSGKFRFIGFGDNVLIVAVDGTVVLDASDHQYLAEPWSKLIGQMAISGPGKDAPTPMFAGQFFDLETAEKHRIDIVIGDEGGVTTSGLFIEKQGDSCPTVTRTISRKFSPKNASTRA
jgi:hypothetical protein